MDTQIMTTSKETEDQKLMNTAVITAPETIELQTTKVPEPSEDEVRIRMEGCGLCDSNLPPWEGRDWFSYPLKAGNPGHEGWGTVDEVGKNVKTVKPGDRVTVLSYNAYAEYDTAKEVHVVKLPDSLNGHPFPGEPLGCAMNVFRRSKIKPGMTVGVMGTGFLGTLLVQLAKNSGARVFAVSRRTSSVEMAKRFGADKAWQLNDQESIVQKIKVETEGDLCDRVIEATGKQKPLDLASKVTGIKGKLIVAGYHQDGRRRVDMQLWNWRGIDVINAHERDSMNYVRGMQEAVNAVVDGRLNPFPLFTHTFPKERIQQAFQIHRQKPEGFTKALIMFGK